MSTKRQVIESFRNKLRERNADSNYSNQFLYSVLMEHAKWLIKREIGAGRIYQNNSLFQTLGCQDVVERPSVECCAIKTNCKIYRIKNKLPETWIDNNGPVLRSITSIDGSTFFSVISPSAWQNKKGDPYQKMIGGKYAFYSDGYIWFPEYNPHKVNISGFYTDDISLLPKDYCSCIEDEKKECVRFLDTRFMLPDWLEAEMFAKALEQIAGISKRLPEDEQIDKNSTRKN